MRLLTVIQFPRQETMKLGEIILKEIIKNIAELRKNES